ncbi:MAG: NAD(P)H-binding protein [Muribaculaceae bacterium]|nr:NAD(P)H-binding protein [Muribaculaceae bacterium]
MKEIALTGMNGHVFADVLTQLLHRGQAVNAFVSNPERVMLENSDLSVSLLDAANKDALREVFEGYHDVIMTFEDDQTDHEANDFILGHYVGMVNAAREAGVGRLVVVGSPEAEAFFMGDLRRHTDIDWVFISTEGDYAARAVDEVITPHFHREKYVEE